LISNSLGGGRDATATLLRSLLHAPSDADAPGFAAGVGELDNMVQLAGAMLYLAASRVASQLSGGAEEVAPTNFGLPGVATNIIGTMTGVLGGIEPGASPEDAITIMRLPPAQPSIPMGPPSPTVSLPDLEGLHMCDAEVEQKRVDSLDQLPQHWGEHDQFDLSNAYYQSALSSSRYVEPPPSWAPLLVGAPPMSRATLLDGEQCRPGSKAWSIEATAAILREAHGMGLFKIGITLRGACYHRLTCRVLFCSGGAHRNRAYHGGVVIQRMTIVGQFNSTNMVAGIPLRQCGVCLVSR
jgi:hypothetical protein